MFGRIAGLKWDVAFGPARHRECSTNFIFTPSPPSHGAVDTLADLKC
jgi:hypothetical protein